MSKATADCGCKDAGTKEKECLCCDIPVFCRNHYYRGKLLTERDFSDEQRYLTDKLRLHSLALHGWGVVCGLVVEPHPFCPDKRLRVKEGFAIDDCGREIRLLKDDDCLKLPQPLTASGEATAAHEREEEAEERGEAREEECEGGEAGGEDDDAELPEDPCDDTPLPRNLYICIRYAECETEFSAAPFDDCSCGDSSQRPNRICEGYKLELYDYEPKFWEKATKEPCGDEHCKDYYREARKYCPAPNCTPCLPLAVIRDFVPGKPVHPDQIDNWRPRRQLVSTSTLDQVVRCILDRLPTEKLTCIDETNWEHARRCLCRDFMEDHVGTHERIRGFHIHFSDKVRSAAIDTRSFQALVVFRPDGMENPRHMQIAPAHIDKEHDDETSWCRLRIDPAYARKHLDDRNFDLFVTLKCDHIRDVHGRRVDGNGDKIEGGTFESWIRVRRTRKA
jgi:hypothetical protein